MFKSKAPILLAGPLLCFVLSFTACEHGTVAVYVRTPPPPPIREVIVNSPGPGFYWVPGYQSWNGSRYFWIPGHWERVPLGRHRWVEGHWRHNGRGWYWVPGHWR
jgi:hypothetical protein